MIDKLLKKAWEHGYYSNNYPSDPNMTWFSDDKQALYSLLMDVIGENVPEEDKINRHIRYYSFAKYHNELLKTQRQKLNQLFNKEK